MTHNQSSVTERLPGWRFWVPLLLQTSLILAIPAQALYTHITGKTVILRTVAVDPYDFLRGYSQTLNYDISRVETLCQLPGWREIEKRGDQKSSVQLNAEDKEVTQRNRRKLSLCVPPLSPRLTLRFITSSTCQTSDYLAYGTRLYVILEAPVTSSTPPTPWKPVRVSSDRPDLPANQIALEGKYTGRLIEYGLETYYMPEAQKDEINKDISQARNKQQSVVVEAKVDAQGHAVPISFWIGDHNYRF